MWHCAPLKINSMCKAKVKISVYCFKQLCLVSSLIMFEQNCSIHKNEKKKDGLIFDAFYLHEVK